VRVRTLTLSDARVLANLAEIAVRVIERDLDVRGRLPADRALRRAYRHWARPLDAADAALAVVDVADQGCAAAVHNALESAPQEPPVAGLLALGLRCLWAVDCGP
jgi:hypothetical protein